MLFLLMILGCAQGDYWYFRTDGVDLPVRVEGNLDSGVFLLMLHGGPQGSAAYYNWGLDTEILEDAYAMVYYDQRGQGGTHGRFDEAAYTVQQLADDNRNLVRAMYARYGDDSSIWLYGHSWGGMLGTATLLDTDAEVAGWIESAGSHDYPLNDIYSAELLIEVGEKAVTDGGEYAEEWADVIARVESIQVDGIDAEEGWPLNTIAIEASGYVEEVWPENVDEESTLYILLNDPTAVATAWWSGRGAGKLVDDSALNLSYTDRLNEITVPSLFLYGSLDFVCPPQLGRDAYERVDTDATEFVVFEDAGHSLMANYPEEYADTIINFVDIWR